MKNKKLTLWTIFALCLVWCLEPAPFSLASPKDEPVESRFESRSRIIRLLDTQNNHEGGRFSRDNAWIVREGISVFVTPELSSHVLSMRDAENNKNVITRVVREVYDATNKYLLIPKGTRISGPTEVKILDGQVWLTIAGNQILDPGWRTGERRYLIKAPFSFSRVLVGLDEIAAWKVEILENPPLSATLLLSKSEDVENDPTIMRLSRDSEGELHMHLPETIELIVRRGIIFSNPWPKNIDSFGKPMTFDELRSVP